MNPIFVSQINGLVKKYEKKRVKHYRKAVAATKGKDMEAQLISAAYQLAYTEIQVDLEALKIP